MTVIFLKSLSGTLKAVLGITSQGALLERAWKKFLPGYGEVCLTPVREIPPFPWGSSARSATHSGAAARDRIALGSPVSSKRQLSLSQTSEQKLRTNPIPPV